VAPSMATHRMTSCTCSCPGTRRRGGHVPFRAKYLESLPESVSLMGFHCTWHALLITYSSAFKLKTVSLKHWFTVFNVQNNYLVSLFKYWFLGPTHPESDRR
jgi:hypothetical protein